eukprot:TRINITY_DN609_c0_g2_i7.p2 TRINITY_DN609_c0_g2~~TRINITY_DN609_c0_g2_i7.p2  ORF type:complete len:194 (-),score=43.55 TRINITY_DN609_c0_g2_i7:1387-1968(-)
MSISTRDETFISTSNDETVRIWDTRSTACQGQIRKSGRVISALDPGGIIFAVGSAVNTISLYDLRTFDKAPFAAFHFSCSSFNWQSVEFSFHGQYLLCLNDLGVAFLVDAFSGNLIFEFHEPGLKVRCITFSPDAQFVIAGLSSGDICIWSAVSGREVNFLKGQGQEVMSIKSNPNMMMFASADQQLTFWSPS